MNRPRRPFADPSARVHALEDDPLAGPRFWLAGGAMLLLWTALSLLLTSA